MSEETGSPTVFKNSPVELRNGKGVSVLCRTDRMFAAVQTLQNGGENNLHSHAHLDGVWFVLRGKVRFYTTDDDVVAELGPQEGILIPRGYKYWFESMGDEELQLLQVEASDVPVPTLRDVAADRIDHSPRTAEQFALHERVMLGMPGGGEAAANDPECQPLS
jgi:mannose-6-phosphate isomerase-like protein (cupin superfamily)